MAQTADGQYCENPKLMTVLAVLFIHDMNFRLADRK